MRKRFSEKYGFTELRSAIQLNNIDIRLKNRIWNVVSKRIFQKMELEGIYIKYVRDENFINRLHDEFFGSTYTIASHHKSEINKLKNLYDSMMWYEVYNFIEELISLHYDTEIKRIFKVNINQILEEEVSGYRFIDDYITPIIEEVEIEEVEEALEIEYNGAKRHLSNALEFLSDRENPDYPNSIKESISAVEAVAKEITGKETDLANCLKVMDLDLNKQFKTAMTNMYGWTCKEDGIRHGHTGEELKTSFEEAKYMLVTCSAFVNYMIAKKG